MRISGPIAERIKAKKLKKATPDYFRRSILEISPEH